MRIGPNSLYVSAVSKVLRESLQLRTQSNADLTVCMITCSSTLYIQMSQLAKHKMAEGRVVNVSTNLIFPEIFLKISGNIS